MITLETFEEYLNKQAPLKSINFSYIGEQGSQISQWLIGLTMLGKDEQFRQLEQVLSELIVVDMSDEQRLNIAEQLLVAVNRLVSKLHTDYIHEPGQLSERQWLCLEQARTLYYLGILCYDGILNRIPPTTATNGRRPLSKLLSNAKPRENILVQTVYQLLGFYLGLLMESALAYQQPPEVVWRQLNRLYSLAAEQGILTAALPPNSINNQAENIYHYYRQACLYGLLRPTSYRRQDIVGIHKVLPTWAKKIIVDIETTSSSKLFVHLESARPPEGLTPYSAVNPYDQSVLAAFIEINPLVKYLQEIGETSKSNTPITFENRLARLALYTLQQQLFQPRTEPRHVSNRKVQMIAGFHRIHYLVAGKQTLGKLIREHELPKSYQPKTSRLSNDLESATKNIVQIVDAKILDESATGYRMSINRQQHSESDATGDWLSAYKVLTLFALLPDEDDEQYHWELGVLRWIKHSEETIETGGRLVGYSLTACGIRLENHDERSQDFIAGLLVAGNETLGTSTSLIVPQYHFKVGDRVVLRIQTKEIILQLQQHLLSTDDIQQFQIVRLGN